MRESLRTAGRCALALATAIAASAAAATLASGCSDSGDGGGAPTAAGTTSSTASTGTSSPATSSATSATGGSGGSSGTGASTVGSSATGGAGGTTGSSATTGASGAGGAGDPGGASGTGGATGSGGSSGGRPPDAGSDGPGGADAGTDAAVPMLVPPIERGSQHVFEFGDTTFAVDGTRGARITAFTMGGKNILTGPEVNARYWGSTFWPAPESEWMTNTMLIVPLDSGPYMMTVGVDSTITAVGATGNVGAKQVSFTKKFTADLRTRSVAIEYSMTNKGAAAFQLGHWEVTRVPPGGLTFYPAGTTPPTVPYGMIEVQQLIGHVWFNHATFPMGVASKSAGDGGGGWIAHVVPDPAGDILLIKTFPDVPAGTSVGTGHSEVEIYAAADRSYVEVEVHNRQVNIMPGQSSPWPVRWYLRRLPAGTMRTAGNQALVDFVRSQLN